MSPVAANTHTASSLENQIMLKRTRRDALSRGILSVLVVATLAVLTACGQSSPVVENTSKSVPASVPAAAPVVTLSTSSSSVATGHSVTLTWNATAAQSCTASGGWSGTEPVSGSLTTSALSTTTTFTLACTGAGGTASKSATVTVSGAPAPSAPSVTLSANPTLVAQGGSSTLTWTSSNATSCTASGGWTGTQTTSGSTSTSQLNGTTIYTLTCSNAAGATASQSATVSVAAPGSVARPSYNTGNGFFVLNGKLYDANGNEFRFRGVDRNHYDSKSQAGIAKSGANAVRIFVESNYGVSAAGLANIVQTQHINQKQVPIPTSTITTAGTATDGNTDPAVLSAVVANWVATASSWTPLNKYQIINIANEWGPRNSTVWRDSYISAIAQMRAAGYLGTLLIDAGGAGQDLNDLLNYSAAVFNSDPQKNVMFALHVYNSYNSQPQLNADLAQLAALGQSVGMAFTVTEFGPGRGVGVSSALTPGQIIATVDANGFGWCAWAWDDNNLAAGLSNNNGFSMTYAGPGIYTQTSDLTEYGQDVVLNPTYGIQALAKPASIFASN
jgi:hypothetical protein